MPERERKRKRKREREREREVEMIFITPKGTLRGDMNHHR